MAKVWLYKSAIRFVQWGDDPPEFGDEVGPIDIPDSVLWEHDAAVVHLDDCPDLDAYWAKHTGTEPFPDGHRVDERVIAESALVYGTGPSADTLAERARCAAIAREFGENRKDAGMWAIDAAHAIVEEIERE